MMHQSTSRSFPTEFDLGANSTYEDAMEESEAELHRLCEDANRHLKKEKPRSQGILLAPMLRPTSSKYKRSSSSEHSSIEKLEAGVRSRRATSSSQRRRQHNNRSGSEHSEEEWRMVNYAFQEVAHYPVLVQINQQLQQLSRQLYEIETTNALQLKIIAHLLGKLIKTKRRGFFSFERVFKALPIILCIIFWPFMASALFKWIVRKRPLAMLKYL